MTQFHLEDTKEKHYKTIERIAKESFADHIIIPEQEEGPIRMWLCRNQDGSGAYAFRVLSGPFGFLAVYGDVGERILRAYGAPDTVGWIRGAKNSTSYVIEKMQNKQQSFMPAEAKAMLDWEIESAGDDEEELERAKAFVAKVEEDWDNYSRDDYDSEQKFIEAWLEHGGESECLESAYDWHSDIYWTVMCLRKFVELYDAKYFPKKDETDARSGSDKRSDESGSDGMCSSVSGLESSSITPRF